MSNFDDKFFVLILIYILSCQNLTIKMFKIFFAKEKNQHPQLMLVLHLNIITTVNHSVLARIARRLHLDGIIRSTIKSPHDVRIKVRNNLLAVACYQPLTYAGFVRFLYRPIITLYGHVLSAYASTMVSIIVAGTVAR